MVVATFTSIHAGLGNAMFSFGHIISLAEVGWRCLLSQGPGGVVGFFALHSTAALLTRGVAFVRLQRVGRLPVIMCDRGSFVNTLFHKLPCVHSEKALAFKTIGDGGYQQSHDYIKALLPGGTHANDHVDISVRFRWLWRSYVNLFLGRANKSWY